MKFSMATLNVPMCAIFAMSPSVSAVAIGVGSLLAVGCSSIAGTKPVEAPPPIPKVADAPVFKLKGYDGPDAMDKQEVLQASKRCIAAKMRPDVQYVSVKVETGGKVLVPVDVQCEPY
jgi:hypothetical protein